MKTLFLLLALAVPQILSAQSAPPAYRIQVGDRLVYQVEAGSRGAYEFVVTVRELGPRVRFDYAMNPPATKTGSVTMTPEAMQKATALYNYFSGGETTLSEETSVFVSTELYNRLSTEAEAAIGFSGAAEEAQILTRLDGRESRDGGSTYIYLTREVNGKDEDFDGPIFENTDGSMALRVQATDYFPIITYMKAGFRVYLLRVERAGAAGGQKSPTRGRR